VVFGAERGDMRVMMLHGDYRQATLRGIALRKLGAIKIGMQIVRHDLRLHVELIAQARHGVVEQLPRLGAVQIADQLRDMRLAAARDADRVFQPGAAGQD